MTWVNVPFCTRVGTFTSFNTTEVVPEIHTSHKLRPFFVVPLQVMVQKPRHYFTSFSHKKISPVQYANETGLGRDFFGDYSSRKNNSRKCHVTFLRKPRKNTYRKRELRGLTNRKNPNLEKPGGRVALPKLVPHAKCEKSCDIGQQENKLCNCVCLSGEGI